MKASSKVEWLIVGLGNPGKRYADTRHNVGWMLIAKLAEKYSKPVMALTNIYLQVALRIEGKLVLGILPTTFMNQSGEAVRKAAELFEVSNDRIVVVSDEYNFPTGKVHLRFGGGDGGHNGISSVIDELDTIDFYRLRCGIGRDFGEGELVAYVLSKFKPEELPLLDEMLTKGIDSIEALIRYNPSKAMSLVNSGQLWQEKDKISGNKDDDN